MTDNCMALHPAQQLSLLSKAQTGHELSNMISSAKQASCLDSNSLRMSAGFDVPPATCLISRLADRSEESQ